MMIDNYTLTTLYVVVMDVMMGLAFIKLIKIGAGSHFLKIAFAAVSVVWVVILFWATNGKHLIPEDISGVTFYILILLFVGLAGGLIFASPLRKVLFNLSQENILLYQGLRVFVAAGFFTEGALGVIPAGFGIMDGFMHMTSAFLALVAAIALLKSYPSKTFLLWISNIVGLLDVVIIATGICFFVFQELGPHHNMMLAVFYIAPIIIWLHFVSIVKLLKS